MSRSSTLAVRVYLELDNQGGGEVGGNSPNAIGRIDRFHCPELTLTAVISQYLREEILYYNHSRSKMAQQFGRFSKNSSISLEERSWKRGLRILRCSLRPRHCAPPPQCYQSLIGCLGSMKGVR